MNEAEANRSGDKIYLETPYVSIRWKPDGPWVLVAWTAWANTSEYRDAHETILLAIHEHRASRLLIASNARVVSQEDQRWVAEDWIPRAVAAGRRWTAVVMPKRALVRTIVENIDKRPTHASDKVGYFGTVDEAATWLSTTR